LGLGYTILRVLFNAIFTLRLTKKRLNESFMQNKYCDIEPPESRKVTGTAPEFPILLLPPQHESLFVARGSTLQED
jgi:hypothetical protein